MLPITATRSHSSILSNSKCDKTEIHYSLFRGGTSQGPIIMESWLPTEPSQRDAAILKLMGSPHETQVDGIGGFHPLKNKLCTVGPSNKANTDIEYCVHQVYRDKGAVDRSIDCGNMLAAVASFAIESGLVKATHPETMVRIFSQITQSYSEATIQTPRGKITYEGGTKIDGVDGSGSPIQLSFLKPSGSTTQKMLPTGNAVDEVDGVSLSCVDVGMPMVIVSAEDFGKTGHESKRELDADKDFMLRLEAVRKAAAFKMGLGDVTGNVMPKICLISSARGRGNITARYMIDPARNECHPSFAITALVCLSAACLIDGTIAAKTVLNLDASNPNECLVTIEHPTGLIDSVVDSSHTDSGVHIEKVSYVRTARKIATGHATLSENISEHATKLFLVQKSIKNFIAKSKPDIRYSKFLMKLASNGKFSEAKQLIALMEQKKYFEVDKLISEIVVAEFDLSNQRIEENRK